MMPVEVNQWQATIGCFLVLIHKSSPKTKYNNCRLTNNFVRFIKVFCCCYGLVAISVLLLPFVLFTQILAWHCKEKPLYFFPFFAQAHFSAISLLHVADELLKRVLHGIKILIRQKYLNFRGRHF